MARIQIGTETEGLNCWAYEVKIQSQGQSYDSRVTLSWSDYDLWSHGRVAPQRVVRAAIEFMLARSTTSTILPKFDCSLLRRYFPEIDRELPKMV